MGLTIGIDVGGSTTKIIGINGGQILSPMFIKAIDPITSLFGAFGKYIYDNEINLEEVEQVVLTGVGSAYVDGNLYGLPTKKVDEFLANGLGACYGSNLENLIVVSMGTGTSFVLVNENGIEHTGGLGIGGGTLQGLSQLLLKTNDIHKLSELASDYAQAHDRYWQRPAHRNAHRPAPLYTWPQSRFADTEAVRHSNPGMYNRSFPRPAFRCNCNKTHPTRFPACIPAVPDTAGTRTCPTYHILYMYRIGGAKIGNEDDPS